MLTVNHILCFHYLLFIYQEYANSHTTACRVQLVLSKYVQHINLDFIQVLGTILD